LLVSLQNTIDEETGEVVKVDSSACIQSYTEFWETYSLLDTQMVKETYKAAREAKGAGSGTDYGFFMSNFGSYNELIISGFDFYNECSLDYYAVGLGSNLQNVSGLSNLATNLAFRVLDDEDTLLPDLATAIETYTTTPDQTNMEALGNASGNIFRILLSVEIPTTSDNEIAYYQLASSFGR